MKYICNITGKEMGVSHYDIISGFKCEFCGRIVETDSEESSIWCMDDSHEISNVISSKDIKKN
jgi:hypothetical protein